MASNDDFELSEKYKDNDWAAFIYSNRTADKLKEQAEKNAASHGCAIHFQDSSVTHERNFEKIDPISNEYSSAKLSIDDMHLFGQNPLLDDVILVMCWDCGKATKVQNLLSHVKDCHESVEEYERKRDVSKKHVLLDASERLHLDKGEALNCSKIRKKESQIVLDGLPEKSKDLESLSNSFLLQNPPVSQLPTECENSVAHSSSYADKKLKRSIPQSNKSKCIKKKTKVSYQSQENIHNSVYSEQSTSSAHRTESVLFSFQTSPDSNHSVIGGHSTLPSSTIYSSNHLKSIKESSVLDFQSKDREEDSSHLNYFNQSSVSVLSKSIDCSDQQPCTNSFESNEVMRTSSNQSFMQMSAKSLFPSSNEQNTDYTDHFLSIENKQPVKSPPRQCIETSKSNSTYESNFEKIDPTSNEYSSAKLSIDDMHLFGQNPLVDDVILVMCWDCGKATKVQNLLSHIKDCHESVEEYEKKMELSKKHATFVASERLYLDRGEALNCSKIRKKESQIMLDGLPEEKSKDLETQSNSFLLQNSPVSQLPTECENSVAHSSSYADKKLKRSISQSNKSKCNMKKTKVSYQSQENVQNLSNSVYSEQSTSSAHRTESVLFSYQTSPDSNHSVIGGHSTTLSGSIIYSSNHLKSIKESPVLDFQSKDREKDSSQLNYFNQSSASVLGKSIVYSDQQPCTNSFESNEVMRTSSNQSFMQMSAKSLFPSSNEQDTDYTNHFLSIENKQPVKSPPRPCIETSKSNNKQDESENSETFLVDNKESSDLSICSSSNSPAGDSLSKQTSIEDKPKNKTPIIHTPALYFARLNMNINRIVQSPYVSVFRSDRSYRLRQALTKSIAEENARIKEIMKLKDTSRCGTESGYYSMSPKSTSEPSNSSAPTLSPISPTGLYLNSPVQQSVNSTPEGFRNSLSESSPNYASEQSSSPPSSSAPHPSQNSLSHPSSYLCVIYEGETLCSLTNSDDSVLPTSQSSKTIVNSQYVNLVNQSTNPVVNGTHRKYNNGCNNVFVSRKNCENNINKTNKCGVRKKQHV